MLLSNHAVARWSITAIVALADTLGIVFWILYTVRMQDSTKFLHSILVESDWAVTGAWICPAIADSAITVGMIYGVYQARQQTIFERTRKLLQKSVLFFSSLAVAHYSQYIVSDYRNEFDERSARNHHLHMLFQDARRS